MKKIIVIICTLIILITIIIKPTEKLLIPNNSIRFRIISDSNDYYDQNIKKELSRNLQKELYPKLLNINDIKEAREMINKELPSIEENINNTLINNNYQKDYKINYGSNYFPEKIYKGTKYKEGSYESLVITLGEGKGNNWWCVLFPPLCLLEAEETEETTEVEYKLFIKEIINKFSK